VPAPGPEFDKGNLLRRGADLATRFLEKRAARRTRCVSCFVSTGNLRHHNDFVYVAGNGQAANFTVNTGPELRQRLARKPGRDGTSNKWIGGARPEQQRH
jgi:hypothetical protein